MISKTKIDFNIDSFYIQLPIGDDKLWKDNCMIRDYMKSLENEYTFRERFAYLPASKLFMTPQSNYPRVIGLLEFLRYNKLPFELTTTALDKMNAMESYEERKRISDTDIPPEQIKGLKTLLRSYQYSAVNFLDSSDGNAIIALGTGVGKTLISLAYCIKNNKKAIIVCPSQGGKTKLSWAKEIVRHTNKKPFVIWGNTPNDLMQFSSVDFIIINYELISKHWLLLETLIHTFGFDVVIVDESHYIKNKKALRTRHIENLVSLCEHRILLSATAIKNTPQELFTQLHLVAPERFTDIKEFKRAYFGKRMNINGRYFFTKQSKKQLLQLNEDIKGCYFYRDKLKIIHELPSLILETIYYELDDRISLIGLDKNEQRKVLAELMIDNTVELVKNTLEKIDKKIIVYSGFVHTTQILKDELVDIATINHGQLSKIEQEENYDSFRNNDKIRCICATYQSFSESINLQDVASVVIFNDTPFVTADIEQAYGRIYRIGQNDICYCYLQGYNGTYTDEVFEILEEKDRILTAVLKGETKQGEFINQVIKPEEKKDERNY